MSVLVFDSDTQPVINFGVKDVDSESEIKCVNFLVTKIWWMKIVISILLWHFKDVNAVFNIGDV